MNINLPNIKILRKQIVESMIIFYFYFTATFGFFIAALLTDLSICWIGTFLFLIMSMTLFCSQKIDRMRLEQKLFWRDYYGRY